VIRQFLKPFDKTVLITGGGSGIGLALAKTFVKNNKVVGQKDL
jgi:short-subunit dehydrogenase involved in D-alanine esterification of teichoic acids